MYFISIFAFKLDQAGVSSVRMCAGCEIDFLCKLEETCSYKVNLAYISTCTYSLPSISSTSANIFNLENCCTVEPLIN